ncbi:uncharacterized protein [Oryza sativa Japonica Group]|uniref:uncharacterized protein n=1 Tax=Oryza sativa subsp. japonica TaxID=39947 RepID=UPI00339BB96B
MEEDEAEDENIPDWAQYAGFEGNQTGEVDRDVGDNNASDDLGQMLQNAKEDCESEKEARKLEQMLEDHRTSLYPGCEQMHKKLDTTLEFLQRKAKYSVSDKRKYIMMPIIIQGPKQSGNNIDVYPRQLVEDFKLLWKKDGVPVWDEDKQEEFNLRALLFVTINDWPALSNLSGQSNKGYKAYTRYLKVVFGKGPGSQPIESEDGHAVIWKKNTIFWELPYWEFLDVRHAIDMMHLTKNLCVNLLGYLGVYGKLKDTLEARNDLKHMEQRDDLNPEPTEKGSHYLSPASYTLNKAEKKSMFECLESIKLPSRYSRI